MGTASFAVPTLAGLLKAGHDVVAVVTAPDRPAGRGKKLRFSPVKEFALDSMLDLLQPERLRDPSFVGRLHELKPDVQVVVAFRLLPAEVWKVPHLGTMNLHASLLPQFRGAAPINHAIMQGQTTTGLTTFLIDEQIDTGRILKQQEVAIGDAETAGELHDRMMDTGAGLVVDTLEELMAGTLNPVSQEELAKAGEPLLPAPKIFKDDCRVNWDRDASSVLNFIRGLSPLPGAYTTLKMADGSSRTLKLFRSGTGPAPSGLSPGILRVEKDTLQIACRDAFLNITELQIEGKRKMQTGEFLRGFKPENVSKVE